MVSHTTCRRCRHAVRGDGRFCPHCGLEWAGQAMWAPSQPIAAPPAPSTMPASDWAAVGEFSVGQFHAAKALLGRYQIPCRVGPDSFKSPSMILEVPQAALVWATSLLAGNRR